jgi:hypothetical protein
LFATRAFEKILRPCGSEEFWSFGEAERKRSQNPKEPLPLGFNRMAAGFMITL